MIRTSESVAAISAAWVAAAAEMPNVPKETKGQVGNAIRYYADMATVVETVRPILAKHGLAYIQGCSDGEKFVTVTTRLVHRSGEWMEDCLSMPIGQGSAQAVGSAISYNRRYSLMALLGLAPDDDDGAVASKPAARKAAGAPTPPQPGPRFPNPGTHDELGRNPDLATEKQIQRIAIGLKGIERDDKLKFLSDFVGHPLASSKELTKTEAGRVIDHLEQQVPT